MITATDANFGRYNITLEYIKRTMAKFPRVNNAVVCLGDSLEVALYVLLFASSRPLLLSTSQAHAEVPQNVFPCTEYCRYPECVEKYTLEYGREIMDPLMRNISSYCTFFTLVFTTLVSGTSGSFAVFCSSKVA